MRCGNWGRRAWWPGGPLSYVERPWSLFMARRTVLSQGNLRLAQVCGMLRSSGRSSVEWGGFLEIDLATQEALRSLGERVRHFDPRGSLEQSADPGRTAAHHRSQHPSPSCAVLTPQGRCGLAGARSRLQGHSGVIRPKIVLCGLLRAAYAAQFVTAWASCGQRAMRCACRCLLLGRLRLLHLQRRRRRSAGLLLTLSRGTGVRLHDIISPGGSRAAFPVLPKP